MGAAPGKAECAILLPSACRAIASLASSDTCGPCPKLPANEEEGVCRCRGEPLGPLPLPPPPSLLASPDPVTALLRSAELDIWRSWLSKVGRRPCKDNFPPPAEGKEEGAGAASEVAVSSLAAAEEAPGVVAEDTDADAAAFSFADESALPPSTSATADVDAKGDEDDNDGDETDAVASSSPAPLLPPSSFVCACACCPNASTGCPCPCPCPCLCVFVFVCAGGAYLYSRATVTGLWNKGTGEGFSCVRHSRRRVM